MGLLDALVFGVRQIFAGDGSRLPQRSNVQFLGAVTDDPINDRLVVDTGAGSGPVDTLVGDGTEENASHILGDVISWEPSDSPRITVKEFSGQLLTNGDMTPSARVLFAAEDTVGYAIDVTATVWRQDGVLEKWKLTCSVSRLDSGPGLLLSLGTPFADATDQAAPQLSLDFSNPSGNDVAILFGDDLDGPYDWTYCARVQRHQKAGE